MILRFFFHNDTMSLPKKVYVTKIRNEKIFTNICIKDVGERNKIQNVDSLSF